MRQDAGEHRLEAFARQPPGAPVVAAAMVTINEQAPVRKLMRDVVPEDMFLEFEAVSPEQRLVRDATEGDDHLQIRHGGQFGLEMAIALADFGGHRLVGRRQAAHGIGDATIGQLHQRVGPFVGAERLGDAGETETMQGRIEQFAGNVAAERSTGAIRPFFARPETDHQQARSERTEGRHRQGMPVGVALADHGKVRSKARTGNAVLRIFEFWHGGNVSMAAMQRVWDIFCRVIDNYGDIGVCWRLARQLAGEHDLAVRLWMDEPASLQALCPALDCAQERQFLDGIEIRHWTEQTSFESVGTVVIEAFACELPASYVQAMAAATPKPHWINLEYLSAENWVEGCHAMASPHPTLALTKHFFFPGFTASTGGLLRERDLLARRAAAQLTQASSPALHISMFCYDTAPLAELLDRMAATATPIICYLPPGKPLAAAQAHLGGSGPWQINQLRVEPIPFLSQDDYDRLLWRCDINFVRGEDSFLRAQWAGRPFVWQIYEQDEAAHLDKLEAFLQRYTADFGEKLGKAVAAMFRAWNTGHDVAATWDNFLAAHAEIGEQTSQWTQKLAEQPDLATRLVKFCSPKV